MATVLEYYRDLALQLSAMPGGHGSLRGEYFGGVTLSGPFPDILGSPGEEIIEGWPLPVEGVLALTGAKNGEVRLCWLRQGAEEPIARFPRELLQAAREFSLTPLGLALLVLAMGGVNDGGRLKALLPDVDKASKGLLLIAVCRLCG